MRTTAPNQSLLSISRRSPTLLPGLILILIIVLPSTFGGLFYDLDSHRIGSAQPNQPPSLMHPLGTQAEGRDVLAELLVGTPKTLRIGLIGGGVGLVIGTALGLISGYFGGFVDTIIRNLVDIGLTIPALAILILISASFPVVTIEMMGLVVASTAWMFPTRVIRSQTLSLRERTYVQMARLSGMGHLQIIFRELMPNLLPFLAANFVSSIAVAILASIGLEVLGLGSPSVTLGRTVYFAIYYTAIWRRLWWWWLPPILILMAIFLGLFLITAALDEFANPRINQDA